MMTLSGMLGASPALAPSPANLGLGDLLVRQSQNQSEEERRRRLQEQKASMGPGLGDALGVMRGY